MPDHPYSLTQLLVAPAPSRILQEEFPTGADGARLTTPAAARRQLPVKTREKKVSHRLSDILKPTNTPSDLWIVYVVNGDDRLAYPSADDTCSEKALLGRLPHVPAHRNNDTAARFDSYPVGVAARSARQG